MIESGDGWYWFQWDEEPLEVDSWECEFSGNEETGPWLPVNPDENPIRNLDLETTILQWQIIADPIR